VFPGAGTVLNVATILVGAAIGVALGHRLPQRTRDVVTDGLGLVTLLIAALNAASVLDPTFRAAVGSGGPVLVVLGAILIGGLTGSLLRLESRLEGLGAWLQLRLGAGGGTDPTGSDTRRRFVEGFVTASLVYVVGPLAILGSLSDGLGRGIDQLALKATLDGVRLDRLRGQPGLGGGRGGAVGGRRPRRVHARRRARRRPAAQLRDRGADRHRWAASHRRGPPAAADPAAAGG
jgi:uncharacterized membrane protein YqgA involved in biofilm formation